MEYELVYDAARDFAGWQVVAGWSVLFSFFVVMIFFTERIPRTMYWLLRINEKDTGWGRTIVFLAVLMLGAVSISIIRENFDLRSISKNNSCTLIAGVVKNFEGEAGNGEHSKIHGHRETFTLNDVEFEYDTSFMATGFNKNAANGGPIHEGAKVRLCYLERIENRKKERKIIRVEKPGKPGE